ncbi:MAG: lipopolysaccharide kinase InaA family protein [Steroidobacteraceae bacterium]
MTIAQAWTNQKLIKAKPGTLIWCDPLPDGGRAVVKMYRRRPMLDPLRRLVVPYRVEREFTVLAHLWRHNVPCPEPLWWYQGRNRAHGRHEVLATRKIPGSIPLVQMLRTSGYADPDLAPVFALARRMHEIGISHGAWYPTNVLVSAPHPGPCPPPARAQ